MAQYLIEDTTLTEIADAIRNKTKTEELIDVSNMSQEINNIESLNIDDYFDTSATVWGSTSPEGGTISYYLKTIPNINTSSSTTLSMLFSRCSRLTSVPDLDTSNVTSMYQMFYICSALVTAPNMDTSNVINMQNMFYGCKSLVNVPAYNTEKVTNYLNLANMFYNCNSLSNESLNNILMMCTNSGLSPRTLKYIGLTQDQANTCTTLSNYQAFIDAGWTTGY